ncbi:hypothetical protein GT348_07740 [Aristophania vespae]|uniref:Uncharacterized protein n=2 Tax=Aristophania vespae TaxID=2697033 RepID=A0A6P1NF15_9PROT|nr:hypothetical protein [Aristophania vespae]QHI96139.1 hypothetical protein GT348_07740 [Aristophania vespae]
MKTYVIMLLLLVMGACSAPHLQTICPILVDYSPTDQQALAKELLQLPDHSHIVRWLGDYIGLRDQVKSCQTKS